ncbi:MAG TPA: AAA family ATPase [Thermoanaerobaculia bacterium]|nr:AAA family ATPase [Thermoanaerobaculia bacterium]
MRARDNPFAAQRLEAIPYRLSGTSWDDLMGRLATLRFRAALVGPHGRGKTTLLEELARRLELRGLRIRAILLREGDRRVSERQRETLFRLLTVEDVLFVDGAEQLSRLAWLEIRTRSRAAGGLVITSHRPGLLPTLHECQTSPELLAGIVAELAGSDAAGGLPSAEELHGRHGGNVRDALRELYDRCAGVTLLPAARRGSPSPPSR